jgi:hypothetical protein
LNSAAKGAGIMAPEHKRGHQNFGRKENKSEKRLRLFKKGQIFLLIRQKSFTEVVNAAVELARMYKNPPNAKCSAENPPLDRNPGLERTRTGNISKR